MSTIRRREVSLALLHALEHHGYTGQVLLSAHDQDDAKDLLARGAHHVLRPYEAAAANAVASLSSTSSKAPDGARVTPPKMQILDSQQRPP